MDVIGGWLQEILLPGFGTVLMGAIFALVRRYIAKLEDERLRELLLELVEAAEQIYGPGQGAEKRRYVMQKLREQGVPVVDRERIEAAVFRMQAG